MMIVVEEIEKNLHDAEHKKIGKCLRLRTPQNMFVFNIGRTGENKSDQVNECLQT